MPNVKLPYVGDLCSNRIWSLAALLIDKLSVVLIISGLS